MKKKIRTRDELIVDSLNELTLFDDNINHLNGISSETKDKLEHISKTIRNILYDLREKK